MSLYIGRGTRRTPEEVGRINPRQPVKPVSLGALARMTNAVETASDPLEVHMREFVL
jgi:hypothetical protein